MSKKLYRRVVALALVAGLVLQPSVSWADNLDEVEEQQETKRSEIQELQNKKSSETQKADEKNVQLNDLSRQQADLETQLRALDETLEQERGELEQTKSQISELEKKIRDNEAEIKVLEGRVSEKKKLFKERLNVMYKNGTIGSVEILLAASNINDFLSRSRTMKTVADYDRNLIEDLLADMHALEAKKNELNGQKAALEMTKKQQDEKVKALEETQAQKTEVLSKLNFEIELTEEQIAQIEAKAAEMQDRIDAKMAELSELEEKGENIRRQQEAERALAAAQDADDSAHKTAVISTGSGYAWPSVDYTITSPFGYRIHPIFGYAKFHSGIDIGADYGTPIFATASGVVTTASWDPGAGNHIVLDHDDGTGSMYAHLSEYNCYVGQHVEKGQIIGYVGSTGNSTGPHLHFEFHINGEPVDPLAYL